MPTSLRRFWKTPHRIGCEPCPFRRYHSGNGLPKSRPLHRCTLCGIEVICRPSSRRPVARPRLCQDCGCRVMPSIDHILWHCTAYAELRQILQPCCLLARRLGWGPGLSLQASKKLLRQLGLTWARECLRRGRRHQWWRSGPSSVPHPPPPGGPGPPCPTKDSFAADAPGAVAAMITVITPGGGDRRHPLHCGFVYSRRLLPPS